jgi:hypothetical protein
VTSGALTRISVVVPVKDQLAVTRKFYDCLCSQDSRVGAAGVLADGFQDLYVMNDGSKAQTTNWLHRLQMHDVRVHAEDTEGMTIYEAWNRGFWLARQQARGAPFHVLVTNNDVLLPPHALAQMSAALLADDERGAAYPDFDAPHDFAARRVEPDPAVVETRGVWGTGGMLGFCFMLAGHRVNWRPLVQDLTYQWWYGDNHLARSIEMAGLKQVRVVGLPIVHLHEATARHFNLAQEKKDDKEHWDAVVQMTARMRMRPPARGSRVVHSRQWRQRPPREAPG